MGISTITKQIIAASAGILFAASSAYALNQSVSANVTFITPLSIGSVTNASFGSLTAGVASTTYVLDTANTVSVSSGPGQLITGTPASASMTISGSGTQTINISSSGYTANGGVTPSAATCKYGAASAVSCDDSSLDTAAAPGSGGTELKMGLTIATTGSETDGATANPSFLVTVVYN